MEIYYEHIEILNKNITLLIFFNSYTICVIVYIMTVNIVLYYLVLMYIVYIIIVNSDFLH